MHDANSDGHAGVAYEKQDVRFRPAVSAVAWLLGFTVLTIAVCIIIWRLLAPGGRELPPTSALVQTTTPRPAPQLQADPARDMREFRRQEEAELNASGEVDPTTGAQRIPVERAMQIAVQEGLLRSRSEPRREVRP